MYRRLIILIIIVLIINCIAISFKISNLDENNNINVDIKGQVLENKTVNLPIGSTFNDLLNYIDLSENADISCFSYNEVLYNNQVINIPTKSIDNLISINNASIDALSCLPGIGKSTAIKIIDYRNTYGSFTSLEELKNVNGIGDKKYEKLKQYITL